VRLTNGKVVEERQAHMRGGVHEPMTRAEVEEKFRQNCAYGGWSTAQADRFLAYAKRAFDARLELNSFR
jgi:hypothetical protein